MQRAFEILDRALSTVLLVLVVAMVASITAEIVLNTAIQPLASHLIQVLDEDGGVSRKASPAPQDNSLKASSGLSRFLDGVVSLVAKASSPLNTASQTLLVWIGILGSALAFRKRAHLGVDALVRIYPRRVRLLLDHLSTALVGLFSLAVLVAGGYGVCQRAFSLGSKMPGLEMVNRGWFYLVLVITGLLNLSYCVYHFVHPRPVEGLRPGEEAARDP